MRQTIVCFVPDAQSWFEVQVTFDASNNVEMVVIPRLGDDTVIEEAASSDAARLVRQVLRAAGLEAVAS